LKSETFARIVKFENEPLLRKKLQHKAIKEGDFVRIISNYSTIIFEINNRIFSICNKIAEKIRVIELL
jgi:hypothetical protein